MASIEIECPNCHLRLHVSQEFVGRKAQCRSCSAKFVIQPLSLDDSVLGWLAEGPAAEVEEPVTAPQAAAVQAAVKSAQARAAGKPRKPVDRAGESWISPAIAPPVSGSGVQLAHVDQLGAFFTFPAGSLMNDEFRTSLPRCCLCCGATNSLKVHLVVWTSKLPDRDRLRLKENSVQVHLRAEELMRLDAARLLSMLPLIPNLPAPYNLPMPYFICIRCSPIGAIMTHVRPRPDGGEECELGIASLKRAAEFYAHNCGRDDRYQSLLSLADRRTLDPWRSLPLAVQNRISHWFEKSDGEHFLSYVPDEDFAKTEAGQGGLVLTNKRLVYHKFSATREIPLTEKLELRADQADGRPLLEIASPSAQPVVLRCDTTATDAIRAILKEAGVAYTYRSFAQ